MTLIHPIPGNIFKSSLNEAHKRASQIRANNTKTTIKVRELAMVEYLGESIFEKTNNVIKKTVNFGKLPDFQRELVSSLTDLDELKRALHSFGWAGKKVNDLSREYRKRMRGMSNNHEITQLRKQYEARTESIMREVENDIKIIKAAEKALKKMPSLKKMKTVLIAGCPNVGKSSILNSLSDSKVDVQPYPFTTKSILVGYMRDGYRRFQLVDTPGVLDRPPKNPIEKQAFIALKHLSKKVLFVFDPSETCGYSMKEQEALLKRIKKEFGSDVLIVYNKADLPTKKTPDANALFVTANNTASLVPIRQAILDWFPAK